MRKRILLHCGTIMLLGIIISLFFLPSDVLMNILKFFFLLGVSIGVYCVLYWIVEGIYDFFKNL